MCDQKGEVQYFIGVQLDGSQHVEPLQNSTVQGFKGLPVHNTANLVVVIPGVYFFVKYHDKLHKPNSITNNNINFNATVSLDGDGDFTTISEAILSALSYASSRLYIRVCSGVYNEVVIVPQSKTSIALVGDGAEVTKITASRRISEFSTSETATFIRELPDANKCHLQKPEDLWANHSKFVRAKPHRKECASWKAIQKVTESGEPIGLKHFNPVKPLGAGDTGSVHLVELCGTGEHFAMKAMDKNAMLNRNKVHRAIAEREILDMLDHPFLPALYASFQTKTHVCLITDYCPGGELFLLLDRQPTKVLKEDAVRFYAAEVIIALEYLHCQGIIYRDLKPENILIQSNGHIALTDFDLSCMTSCMPQLLLPEINDKKRQNKAQQNPIFLAEPMRASNSFVGTEEYIAPEIIGGAGHTSAVDWWALGILIYEMLYGYTPFRGKTRQKTFTNVLQKNLKFPSSKQVSLHAKQLIYQLLQKDPKSRLGAFEGANEIKRHPFFRGVNWALVRGMKPPELEVPFSTDPEKEAKIMDPEMLDLQTNVF